jgi:hypothetical protein
MLKSGATTECLNKVGLDKKFISLLSVLKMLRSESLFTGLRFFPGQQESASSRSCRVFRIRNEGTGCPNIYLVSADCPLQDVFRVMYYRSCTVVENY